MNSAVTVLPQRLPVPRIGCQAPPPALRLLTVVVEAMLGRRPLHQIRPFVKVAALGQITACVDSGFVRQMRLGSILTQMPSPRSVEAVVRLMGPGRAVACAVRLDAQDGCWRCTEASLLLPDALAA